MSMIKTGSPSGILKVAEVVKEGDRLKVTACVPGKPVDKNSGSGEPSEKIGGTKND